MLRIGKALLLVVFLTLSSPCMAEEAASSAGVLFLTIVNSARANGMGVCPVTLVDEQAALYNPGALGLFHLNKLAAVSLPNNSKWLPRLVDDIRLRTWGMNAGVSFDLLQPDKTGRFNLSLGFAYFSKRLSYGKVARTEEGSPEIVGFFEPWDETHNYSVGLGFELERVCRIGVGLTHKKITSKLSDQGAGREIGSGEAEGNAVDLGIIVEVPVMELISSEANGRLSEFELTASAALVQANIGDGIRYIDADQSDQLPELRRMGLSLYLAAHKGYATLFSGRLVGEIEKDLVDDDAKNIYKGGLEFGLVDILFLRAGRFTDDSGDRHFNTWGFGLSLNGAISWLEELGTLRLGDGLVGRLVRNVDASYDFAKFHQDEYGVIGDSEFFKVSTSL